MVLQRHARGRAGRKWWARIKQVKIREAAALRLQTLARGMIAREVFRHRHENAYRTLVEGPACLLIQTTWRMHAQYSLR